MHIDAVIAHIRKYVPLFAGRVAGAANFAVGLQAEAQMDFPSAYVIPLDEDADSNGSLPGLYQNVTERIGVVVAFANSTDRRGQSATVLFEPTRLSLFRALLNWRPPPLPGQPQRAARGLEYGGGRSLDFDRARLWYQFEFNLDVLFTDEDGWREPADPLTAIRAEFDTSTPHDGLPDAAIDVAVDPTGAVNTSSG